MGKAKLFTDAMWPPTLEQVKIYFSQKGMNEREARDFFELYQLKQWRSKKGTMITAWKKAAHSWIFSALKAQPWLFNKNIH